MFALRAPCANCPFRIGQGSLFRLAPGRIEEIAEATAFECHKTAHREDAEPRQCAGLMALLHREGQPNTIMRAGMAFGAFNPAELDARQVYLSLADAKRAHYEGKEPDQ